MANRPQSRLTERMEYHIAPQDDAPRTDTIHRVHPDQHPADAERTRYIVSVRSPEELRVGDSAAGSGHMLLYAFDLLYAIYEEEGYNPPDIPRLILEKNLYGMEIDARSAALAAFALTMKARRYDRRFFRRGVRPNICVLHSVHFTVQELSSTAWLRKLGANLLDLPVQEALLHDLHSMGQAGLVGSLLRPQLTPAQITRVTAAIDEGDDLFTQGFNDRVRDVLAQMAYLARKYHVVVANPPYLGKGLDEELKDFLATNYADVKSDLFAAFVVRNTELTLPSGQLGFMTPFVWMFISSYEKLREFLIARKTITALVQLEYSGFEGATVPICIFTLENAHRPDFKGGYIRLSDFRGADNQAPKTLEAVHNPACGWFYRASAADFKKIPGAPIAYWVSEKIRQVYSEFPKLADIVKPRQGLATSDNDRFLRLWYEVAESRFSANVDNRQEAKLTQRKWFPCQKGGSYRKWYGNNEYVVNWFDDGSELIALMIERYGSYTKRIVNAEYYFKKGITWSTISSSAFSMRYCPPGFIFETKGSMCFAESDRELFFVLAFCNTKLVDLFLSATSPTLDYHEGPIGRLPLTQTLSSDSVAVATHSIGVARTDWDAYETSWDFTTLPLLRPEHRQATLAATYAHLRGHWQAMTDEMQRLEEENNRIFIDAYGLQDELTPDVPLHEITLTSNPHYRYSGQWSVVSRQLAGDSGQLEQRLLADTMREFISYAVGCMFGRYSLDKPGLILANVGETVEDYDRIVRTRYIVSSGAADSPLSVADPQDFALGEADSRFEGGTRYIVSVQSEGSSQPPSRFMPDRDNVIPLLDGEWFADDIVDRFKRFLRVTFGEAHFTENLAFIEQALDRDLRSYFLREFYDDHVKRYQKRPIYWLFSSPKGSFNALIYMHRYRPDTVSVVLNEYLRNFHSKLEGHKRHLEQVSISASATPRERTAALKEIDKLEKSIAELTGYENEVLYPLATQQVAIDLDDGVKVNYVKFGKALRKIVGVSG
jgi:type II restriction/modification system DNA methylase subunit YeeA